jgi:hypothetical protein
MFYYNDSANWLNSTTQRCVNILTGGSNIYDINLTNPYDAETTDNLTIQFLYTYNGTSPDTCSLYVDGSLKQSDSTITENTTQSFSQTLIVGLHSAYIWCNSTDGTSDNSNINSFTINTQPFIVFFTTNTLNNGTYYNNTANYTYIEAAGSDDLDTCLLNWNATNYSMTTLGDGSLCYVNMTDLSIGNYYFFVYANDTAGDLNQTDDRNITLAELPTGTCTPVNGTNYNELCSNNCTIKDVDYVLLNITLTGNGGFIHFENTTIAYQNFRKAATDCEIRRHPPVTFRQY